MRNKHRTSTAPQIFPGIVIETGKQAHWQKRINFAPISGMEVKRKPEPTTQVFRAPRAKRDRSAERFAEQYNTAWLESSLSRRGVPRRLGIIYVPDSEGRPSAFSITAIIENERLIAQTVKHQTDIDPVGDVPCVAMEEQHRSPLSHPTHCSLRRHQPPVKRSRHLGF